MRHRGQFTQSERFARSRLAKLLHEQPFLCGSLVTMHRLCGKEGCKCTRGELHPGLYLAIRAGGEAEDDPYPSSSRTDGTAVGGHLSGELATHGEDFPDLLGPIF